MTKHCLLVLALVACSSIPTNPIYKCDELNPCPVGACIDGLCSSGNDGMVTNDEDMAADGSSNKTACASGDPAVLGPKAAACAGECATGQCDQLCNVAQNWHICTNANGIDLKLLKAIEGYYIANVPGQWFNPARDQPNCGLATSPALPLFYGGGKSTIKVSDTPAKQCSGFSQSVECGSIPFEFQCQAPYDLAHLANTVATNGVLCCKP